MAVIRITKKFKFEMAHALPGYQGPCRNLHGHSYELLVTVKGQPNSDPAVSDYGMVMDMKGLKQIVKQQVVDRLDHAVVLQDNQPLDRLRAFDQLFGKLVAVPYHPSLENMLDDFAQRIRPQLPASVKLHSLHLKETVTSWAEWHASDNE